MFRIQPSINPVESYRKRRSHRTLFFCGVAVALVMFVGMLIFLIKKEVNTLRQKNGEREWLSQSLATIARLNDDEKRSLSVAADFAAALPLPQDVKTGTDRIITIAHIRSLNANFKITGLIADDDVRPLRTEFSMSVDGTLLNIINFTSDLEDEKMIIEITKLDIATVGASAHATITGALYTRKK